MSEKKERIGDVLKRILDRQLIIMENQRLILNELKTTGEKELPKSIVRDRHGIIGSKPDSKPVVKQEIELPKVKTSKKISPGFETKEGKSIYELPGKLVAASDKAFCINLEGHKEEWFPKSQITNSSYINDENFEDTQIFNFTEWILKQKGVL